MGIGKGYCIEQDLEDQIMSLKEVIAKQKETIDRQGMVIKELVKAGSALKKYHAFIPDAVAFLRFEAALESARKIS